MASTSSAASSTLSRARVAIVIFTAAAAAYGIYTALEIYNEEEVPPPSTLHRSNAVHRRRRPTAYRPRAGEVPAETTGDFAADASFFAEDTEDDEPAITEGATGAQPPIGVFLEPVVSPSDDSYDSVPWAAPRNGQNMVSLLFSISEDATRRNSYVHRGTLCNGCGAVPIRGIRYRCANCADYDLCETCEAQGQHYRTHVFYKIKVPITNYAPRHLQTPFYPGNPDHHLRPLPRDIASRLTTETSLDRPEIEAYWEQWTCIANTEIRDDPDGLHMMMDRRTFDRYLIPSNANRYSPPNLIHDRMFAFYDQDGDGLISFLEYLQGLAYRKSKNKLKRIFQGYDINGDGYVDRKDFLRIFRSYYVLYKNMRKDMLERMDESVVNGVDAHALIQGRQPLSSAFGRDGQFGSAHTRNRPAGKQMNQNGDLEITDGGGIVLPDSEDVADRDDVFRNSMGRYQHFYLSLLGRPPASMRQLQRELTESVRADVGQDEATRAAYTAEQLPRDPDNSDENVLGVDDTATAGAARREEDHQQKEDHLSDILHERWRRRQFYTDEEEGAEPPSDWEDDDDIPEGNVEDEEEPSRPMMSPRSRSSSKVRFAEDMDDYDTRSNPSTSSRSIPERWGGMEIADAERDVGKDVLYQVTQQAFNELLDNLFKNIEDEAINSLTSSQTREKNRPMFTNKYFVKWAEQVGKIEDKPEPLDPHKPDDEAELRRQMREGMQREIADQAAELHTAPIELDDTRQLDIDDLLAMSGYAVDETDPAPLSEDTDRLTQITSATAPESSVATSLPAYATQPAPAPQRGSIHRSPRRGSETPSENLRRDMLEAFRAADPFLNIQEDIENEPLDPPIRSLGRLPTDPNDATEALREYRDPTLPQFRPNSVPPAAPSPPSAVTGEDETGAYASFTSQRGSDQDARTHRRGKKYTRYLANGPQKANTLENAKAYPHVQLPELRNQLLSEMKTDPTVATETRKQLEAWNWMALCELRELEEVEKKARSRGGWARINYEEFEEVLRMKDKYWKKEREEEERRSGRKGLGGRTSSRLREREQEMERMVEYLGSWIELCIQ